MSERLTTTHAMPTWWEVRGEDNGLRAVLHNPTPRVWWLHTISSTALGTTEMRERFASKGECLAFLRGYQRGHADAEAGR